MRKLVLKSIIKLLQPSWEYYMLAKGRLAHSLKISNGMMNAVDVQDLTNNVLLDVRNKYECPVEMYDFQLGFVNDDFTKNLSTMVMKFRSNFE